jgi:hypothetical protein
MDKNQIGQARRPPAQRIALLRVKVLEPFGPDVLEELQIPAFLRRGEMVDAARLADVRQTMLNDQQPQKSISELTGLAFPEPPQLEPELAPKVSRSTPPLTAEELAQRSLSDFLAELDWTGGRVLPRELLAKHGIVVEGEDSALFDLRQASRQLAVLVEAFEEAADYDLKRHHNQPPPALWISSPDYLSDLRGLLVELRRLNDQLASAPQSSSPKHLDKSTSLAIVAGKKFVESYVDVLGKGAAALTIGGFATLFISLGVDKTSVEAVWNLLKSGR